MGGSTLNQLKEKEMKTKKQIQPDRWIGYIDAFIRGNRGRIVKIELYNEEVGKEIIAINLPLLELVYDPVGKGDALTIGLGHEKVEFSHVIESPNEIWEIHDINGQVQAMEITDQNDTLGILCFEDQ